MKNMMREAHTTRLRVTKELQLNKAKEEANADGYSAVSSSTELTKGMRIQFIDPFNQWSNGDIKDIRNDGKVAVRTPFEFLDRDRLRIPDE